MNIATELLDEIVAHALEDPRNEVCGVVAAEIDDSAPGQGHAVRVHRARNLHASPLRFEIEPKELLQLSDSIDDAGLRIGAIYHSHVRSAPYPSQTDIAFSAGWPDVEWIIVGLSAGAEPEVRSFLIVNENVQEVALGTTP